MKNFTKLFLLALCTGFLLLGFSDAQNLTKENSYTNEYNTNEIPSSGIKSPRHLHYSTVDFCVDIIPPTILSLFFLNLVGLIFILLSLGAIPLYKKFKTTEKNARLFCIPLLNIHFLSKITIGKIRFYCLILLMLFLGYMSFPFLGYISIYHDKCYKKGNLLLFILGVFSIIILLILGYKLIGLYLKTSDKESVKK